MFDASHSAPVAPAEDPVLLGFVRVAHRESDARAAARLEARIEFVHECGHQQASHLSERIDSLAMATVQDAVKTRQRIRSIETTAGVALIFGVGAYVLGCLLWERHNALSAAFDELREELAARRAKGA